MRNKKTTNFETFFLSTISAFIVALGSINPHLLTKHLKLYIMGMKLCIVILAFASLYLAFILFRYYRAMENTPTSKIRSCAQGFAELEGIQDNIPEQVTLGKLSQTNYTWYRYTIEKYTKNSSNKYSYWKTIEEGSSNNLFQISDGTGTCIIHPQGAQIQTPYKLTWKGFDRTPSAITLQHRLLNTTRNLFGQYRYTEYYMLPKTPIYAIGMFHTKNQRNYLTNQYLPDGSPFILSVIPQQQLITQYKYKTIFYMILFITLASTYPIATKYYFRYWNWTGNYTIAVQLVA